MLRILLLPVLLSGRASGFDSVLPSGPDIAQFKQGVKTVAGKMAVLANGVMNTIQVRRQSSARRVAFCVAGADLHHKRLFSQDRYGSY